MDVLERKGLEPKFRYLIKQLQYGNHPIILAGTGGLNTMNYTSDIDLISNIGKPKDVYKNIFEIVSRKIKDLFFIEGKIQGKEKFKFYNIDDLIKGETKFKKESHPDMVKLDYIIFIDGLFREVSIIYNFTEIETEKSEKEIEKTLNQDLNELINDGSYYKALKRVFSLLSNDEEENKPILVKLSKIFNSNIGFVYQRLNNLRAVKLFINTFNDTNSKNMALLVLKNLGYQNITKLDHYIKVDEDFVNKSVEKYFH